MKQLIDKYKRYIIAGAAVILFAVILLVVLLSLPGGNEGGSEETSATETLYETLAETEKDEPEIDISATEDGEVDPENNEITEEGADVNASELVSKVGVANGIDVSKWQGRINWQAVKASGIDFAYIRIGYRGENGKIFKDDNADYNIQQADKAGVLVGVYFFSTAVNPDEAKEEADWTLKAIEGYSISYPVVYDCEGFKNESSRMYGVSAAQRTENAIAFLGKITNAGYDAMHYGARNELVDPSVWATSLIDNNYKIWVAQYPAVTYPEKETPDYSGPYDAWQYTNKGKVDGIDGNVDMIVSYFTCEKKSPKNPSAKPGDAAVPLTNEEKIYTPVSDTVTAKKVTNLRDGATTKSNVVATIENGQTVQRVGIGSNGWSKLVYNGKTVYAITSYLTTELSKETEPPETQDIVSNNIFTPQSDKVTAKNYVNLRMYPTTDSEVVGFLEKGTFIERVAVSNKGWSRLIYNGQTVYAVTSYLTTEAVDSPETENTVVINPETEPAGFIAQDKQVTAKLETNLRTAPSTVSSEVVYTLKNGEYIHMVGLNSASGWAKLIYNGQTVYAVYSYLLEEGAETEAESDSETIAEF